MQHCDILIIDDYFDDVELLLNVLNKNGVEQLQYVHSAKEALQYLGDNYPDFIPKVIVIDVLLPGIIDGEFFASLKSLDLYKVINVVTLSSAKSNHYIERLPNSEHLVFLKSPST